MPAQQQNQSGTGLNKETAAALSYVLGPISGLIFLLLEKDSFVRFHAMQSIAFSVAALVLNSLVGLIPILNLLVGLLVLFEFAIWLVLLFKATQGERWELPYIGPFVTKMLAGK